MNETIGLPLALSVIPEVREFPGAAVLELVEPGLFRSLGGQRVEVGSGGLELVGVGVIVFVVPTIQGGTEPRC